MLSNRDPVLLLSRFDSGSFGSVRYNDWRGGLAVEDSLSFGSL